MPLLKFQVNTPQDGGGTEGARQAIRWTYYGGVVSLLLLQVVVMLFWPDEHLHSEPQTA